MASVPNSAAANGSSGTNGFVSPFVAALQKFKSSVKKGTRDLGLTTLDELEDEIHKIQTEQHKRRTMRNFGRLRDFLEAANDFGKVIEVYCQVHEIVAFIWVRLVFLFPFMVLVLVLPQPPPSLPSLSNICPCRSSADRYLLQGPLKLLLQIASNHVQAIDELVGVYQDLGKTMKLLQQSWDLHPQDTALGSVLAEVYECILDFHSKALGYFHKPSRYSQRGSKYSKPANSCQPGSRYSMPLGRRTRRRSGRSPWRLKTTGASSSETQP